MYDWIVMLMELLLLIEGESTIARYGERKGDK